MGKVKLNFDRETLSYATYAYKLLNEARKKIQDLDIKKIKINVGARDTSWLTDLSSDIFINLIQEEEDILKSDEVENILRYYRMIDFYEDLSYGVSYDYIDDYIKDYGTEAEKKNSEMYDEVIDALCEDTLEDYINAISLREMRIKMKDVVDVSKISEDELEYVIPNIIKNKYLSKGIVLEVKKNAKNNEIRIEYLYDDNEFYPQDRESDIENCKMVLNLVMNMEGLKKRG